MRVLLDTGPLVALLNRRDTYHTWSLEQASTLDPPFYCCEAVIAEAHFLLSGVHLGNKRLNELLTSGKINVSFSVEGHLERIGTLMDRYANVPMSFADACLVCMVEEKEGQILTLDSDFHVYRKKRKGALHLIAP